MINNSLYKSEDCSVLLVIILILVLLLPLLLHPGPLQPTLVRRGPRLSLGSAADPGVGAELSVAVVNAPILQNNITHRKLNLIFGLPEFSDG